MMNTEKINPLKYRVVKNAFWNTNVNAPYLIITDDWELIAERSSEESAKTDCAFLNREVA